MIEKDYPAYNVRALLLILSLISAGCSATQAGTLQNAIESASVRRTFALPSGTIRGVVTAVNTVGVELSTSDSSIVQLLSSDGRPLFHHARVKVGSRNSIYALSVSDDGSTVMFSEDLGDRDWRCTAYAQDGRKLFAVKFPGDLKPSPSGQYFTNIPNSVTGAPFTIVDRNGQTIRAFWAEAELWGSIFISDDMIVAAGPDSARWVEAATGAIIKSLPLQLSESEFAPRMAVSSADSLVIVFDEHAIAFLSFDGRIIWESHFDDFVYAIYPRTEGEFIAIQFGLPGKNRGYIRVLTSKSPEHFVDSPITDFMTSDVVQRQHPGWYSGDIIAIWGPARYVLTDFHSGFQYKTLFYHIQSQPLSIVSGDILPEIYAPISVDRGSPALMRVVPDGGIEVLSVRTSVESSDVK